MPCSPVRFRSRAPGSPPPGPYWVAGPLGTRDDSKASAKLRNIPAAILMDLLFFSAWGFYQPTYSTTHLLQFLVSKVLKCPNPPVAIATFLM